MANADNSIITGKFKGSDTRRYSNKELIMSNL